MNKQPKDLIDGLKELITDNTAACMVQRLGKADAMERRMKAINARCYQLLKMLQQPTPKTATKRKRKKNDSVDGVPHTWIDEGGWG